MVVTTDLGICGICPAFNFYSLKEWHCMEAGGLGWYAAEQELSQGTCAYEFVKDNSKSYCEQVLIFLVSSESDYRKIGADSSMKLRRNQI